MPRENLIGEYLRARRELVRPEDIGVHDLGGRRRVAALRRSEVALLAGMSTDYYVRLEQGRDQHPSPQVLDALGARALQLDEYATAHLHRIANTPTARCRKRSRPEKAPARILQLIQSWTETPAFVEGRYTDVLAANSLATALAPHYAVGTNLVRATFLDPGLREMYDNWEAISESAVAALRALVGHEVDDPRLTELVGDLSVRCERFRQLWARHDVRPKRSGWARLAHPIVGPLDLRYEKFPIPDTDSQTLGVYHAVPGSPSARALAQLANEAVQRSPLRGVEGA